MICIRQRMTGNLGCWLGSTVRYRGSNVRIASGLALSGAWTSPASTLTWRMTAMMNSNVRLLLGAFRCARHAML